MDSPEIIRFVAALALVIGLIMGCAYLLRRFSLPQQWLKVAPSGGRLSVVEVRYLDARRRLVLVRRDDTEHLLLLSETQATVVESGIKPHA